MPNARRSRPGWLAANYLGAVHVPINTGYRGRLLQHAIELSDATVMVAHASLLPRLQEIDTAQLRDVIVVGAVPAHAGGLQVSRRSRSCKRAERAEPSRPVEPWDPNFIILTSGTTGPSKAVISTYVQTWCGGAMGMDYFDADDRVLANLPLFHVSGAGAVMDRLTKGGTCILMDGFKPATFWDTVRRFEITGCCLVGAMTQFLLRQPPSDRDRDHPLRNVVTVPWNQDSRAVAERYGLQMHTAFNMTETAVPIRSERQPGRARYLRPAAPGRRGARRGWQRHRSAGRRGRRADPAHVATVGDHAGLLPQPAGDRGGVAQRLVPHRRRVQARRRRAISSSSTG